MELRLIALILSFLALAIFQAREDGFGNAKGFTEVFQSAGGMGRGTAETVGRSSFSPLALPETIQIGRGGEAKFIRVP